MVKCYLVSSGEYSDYEVHRVFSTKELAEEWVGDRGVEGHSRYRVEEHLFDDMSGKEKNKISTILVVMDRGGTVHRTSKEFGGESRIYIRGGWQQPSVASTMEVEILTTDESTAIKAANEIRIRLLALDRWTPGWKLYDTLEPQS